MSISTVSITPWNEMDWWIFLYIITTHLAIIISINAIEYFIVQNSKSFLEYKLHLHKLFEKHKDNLESVKQAWIKNEQLDFTNWVYRRLYYISYELKLKKFQISIDEIYDTIKNKTLNEYLIQKGFDSNFIKNKKIKKSIFKLKKSYLSVLKYGRIFDEAERKYLNGSLLKTYEFSVIKTLIHLFEFLITFSVSVLVYVNWEATAISKLIILFILIIIDVIVAFPETKERKKHAMDYWDNIENGFISYEDNLENH